MKTNFKASLIILFCMNFLLMSCTKSITRSESASSDNPTNQPSALYIGADGGPDLKVSSAVGSVTLGGSVENTGSSHLTYSWKIISGSAATITSPNSLSTSVTGLSAGTYVFRLTVTEADHQIAVDDINVVVGL